MILPLIIIVVMLTLNLISGSVFWVGFWVGYLTIVLVFMVSNWVKKLAERE